MPGKFHQMVLKSSEETPELGQAEPCRSLLSVFPCLVLYLLFSLQELLLPQELVK